MFKNVLLAVIFISSCHFFGRNDDSLARVFRNVMMELRSIEKGFLSKKEAERIEANKKYLAAWNKIVMNPKILDFTFDSLKEVSILSPKDKKFMLITWNLPKDDGTHNFFGYLLVNNSKRIKKGLFKHETISQYEYFVLFDQSLFIKNPETYVGTTGKWFGMLYYDMIETGDNYTLLGFDPNDNLTKKKFVDVLWFRADGTPFFGKDIFKFPKKNPRRLMFEYSADVSMSLKYNDKRDQIIYSHLAPREEGPMMEGLPQYYGPDGSYDALQLKKDKWVVVEDVDARNERSKNDRKKKPDPKEQKPVYTPK
jgi:hypothetical protein